MTEAQNPRPTTDDILAECPHSEYWSSEGFELFDPLIQQPDSQFAVWSGKVVTHQPCTVAHRQRGTCDIQYPIISEYNDHFVLHNSMGFELDNTKEFETAKEFFESWGKKLALKERVHAIWLCIKVPHAGPRVLEERDKQFLKLAAAAKGNKYRFCNNRAAAYASNTVVPVVAVFTQFAILYSRMERALTDEEMKLPADQIQWLCSQRAEYRFKTICLPQLQNMDDMRELPDRERTAAQTTALWPSLSELLYISWERRVVLLNAHNRETVCINSAIAQHGSAQANIEEYWRGIASSTGFSGFKLEKCLITLHIDIVIAWNFSDPNKLLHNTAFVEKMRTITQVVVPREDEANDWFGTVKGVMSAAGAAGTTHPIALPIVAGIGLSGIFINWLATVYKRTPETLRLFMGYIVDLTLVLDQLFVIVLALGPPILLTQTEINTALDKYTSGVANTVHKEIREYCNDSTFTKMCCSNKAEEKITELIDNHHVKWEGTETVVFLR
ncbi:hypothetical protein C8J57DRAFT_1250975 [Mycena rebaudengoi]|nr:hypothetical protein C8J57DRAFT_1250975 [Mycena rebaudengoi]